MDDSTIVDREIRVAAPPQVVAAFFTDPVRVVTWMATRADVRAVVGGKLRLEFDRPGGTIDVVVGEFVEVSPRRIIFTWGFESGVNLPPGASRVEVTLTPDGDGTLVRLIHVGLPIEEREAHAGGWSYFLERLKAAAAS